MAELSGRKVRRPLDEDGGAVAYACQDVHHHHHARIMRSCIVYRASTSLKMCNEASGIDVSGTVPTCPTGTLHCSHLPFPTEFLSSTPNCVQYTPNTLNDVNCSLPAKLVRYLTLAAADGTASKNACGRSIPFTHLVAFAPFAVDGPAWFCGLDLAWRKVRNLSMRPARHGVDYCTKPAT